MHKNARVIFLAFIVAIASLRASAAVFEGTHVKLDFDGGTITPRPFAAALADYAEAGGVPASAEISRNFAASRPFPSLSAGSIVFPGGAKLTAFGLPAPQPNRSVIFEAVIRPTGIFGTAGSQTTVASWYSNGGNLTQTLQLIADGAGGGVLRASTSEGIAVADVRTPDSFSILNRRMHVAVVFDEASGSSTDLLSLYVDGTLIGSVATTASTLPNPGGLSIGGSLSPTDVGTYVGGVDGVLVRSFTGPVTPAEFALLPEPATASMAAVVAALAMRRTRRRVHG